MGLHIKGWASLLTVGLLVQGCSGAGVDHVSDLPADNGPPAAGGPNPGGPITGTPPPVAGPPSTSPPPAPNPVPPVEEPPETGTPNPNPPDGPTACSHDHGVLTLRHEIAKSSSNTQSAWDGCEQLGHVLVIPRGSVWKVSLAGLPEGTRVEAFTAHYLRWALDGRGSEPASFAAEVADDSGIVELELEGQFGGEHALVVSPPTSDLTGSYVVSSSCVSNCDNYTTRYPVILLHGLLGTDRYIGLVDYWWDIIPKMRATGTEVFNPVSNMVDVSSDRAAQQWANIENYLELVGARKVNLIGHSQGGLDARYIASPGGLKKGEQVASVTTMATPHRGVPIPLLDWLSQAIDFIFDFQNFSPSAAVGFNDVVVDHLPTEYYSWSFRTCVDIDVACIAASGGELVGLELAVPHLIVQLAGGENDGLVTVESAKWGTHLGTLWADHLDQIGHFFRLSSVGPYKHRDHLMGEIVRLMNADH